MNDRFQETRDRCYTYFIDNDLGNDRTFNTLMSADTVRALNCQWIFDQYMDGYFQIENIEDVKDVIQQFYRNRNKLPRDRRELSQYSYPEVLEALTSLPGYIDRRKVTCKAISDRLHIDPNIFDVLLIADPEGGKNCQWIFDQYKNRMFLLEDVNRVRDDIDLFLRNRVSLPERDRALNKYTYDSLKQLITRWDLTDYDFTPVISDNPDILVLSHTGYGKLSTPKTEEASCLLGTGTKWCTAARVSDNEFYRYNKDGPLYVWEDYHRKKKYQFHFETLSFMDNMDDEIDHELLTYYMIEHPVLSLFFEGKEEEMSKDPEWTYGYADHVIGDRWYEKEPIIMSNPVIAAQYARNVIQDLWPEAEDVIMQNPEAATIYAKDVIGDRWYDAEPYIMQDPAFAAYYAYTVVQDRWPEAEPIIAQNAKEAYNYARIMIRGRWHEAEPYIMKDYNYVVPYTKNFIGRRWPEAEPYILRMPFIQYDYAKDIIKGRWPEAEPIIMKDSIQRDLYARNIIKGKWP